MIQYSLCNLFLVGGGKGGSLFNCHSSILTNTWINTMPEGKVVNVSEERQSGFFFYFLFGYDLNC